jgi:hypothetical protein
MSLWMSRRDLGVKTVLEDSLVRFPASGDAPGYHVAEQSASLFSIRLWGRLEAQWAGNLSLGLSWAGFDIMAGFARRNRTDRWVVELLVSPTEKAPSPHLVDFLALSRAAHPEAHPGPVELTSYALDGSPDQGAAFFLEVRGPDRIGFLGSFLRSLSEVGLSPTQMALGTRDGEVSDRFLLRPVRLDTSREDLHRCLSRTLEGLVRPRTAAPAWGAPGLDPFVPK